MIPAEPECLPRIEALLGARPTLAMFPLANLRDHGTWDTSDHPRAMRFWIDHPKALCAVLGLTREGMVMPFGPVRDPAAWAACLAGHSLMGAAGPARSVRPVLKACGLGGASTALDADEPHYLLPLDALRVPGGPGALAPLSADPAAALGWRAAYDAELHVATVQAARDKAMNDVEAWIARDSHRLLMVDGAPVAMTGFNARLPEIVQVGGVYVPPALRRRGFARRAVALHLAEARAEGVRTATLFAASAGAAALYEGLSFERIGAYALVLFDGRAVVSP